jgi:hypothetical protein
MPNPILRVHYDDFLQLVFGQKEAHFFVSNPVGYYSDSPQSSGKYGSKKVYRF